MIKNLNELNRFYLKSPKENINSDDEERIFLYKTLDKFSLVFSKANGLEKLYNDLEQEINDLISWCYFNLNENKKIESDQWKEFYKNFIDEFIYNSAKYLKNDKFIHNQKTIRIFIDTLKMYIINNEEKIEEIEGDE